jgi:two-component system, OmpR family, sensor histidine kinase KdpD
MVGSAVGILLSVALGAAEVPLRAHLAIATAALVLVVPVVAGSVVGGFRAGVVSVAAGFLVYDFLFIPPYGSLAVWAPQNWVALGVYAVVMLLVARVLAPVHAARSEAQRRAKETARLYELSELLVGDRSVGDLLETIVQAVRTVFDVPGVALLLPVGGRLALAASAGEPLSPEELSRLDPTSGVPVSVGIASGIHDTMRTDTMRTVALIASGRPVGILAMHGVPSSGADRALLGTFANHAALALERVQLREQALRSELLEEIDRLRHALVGAVSHDLRTPLASMKVASSTLLDPAMSLSADDTRELHGLIDIQTDRLTRLVTSLLDMTRVQAGALEVHRGSWSVLDLVGEAVAGLLPALEDRPVRMVLPAWLPEVDVDQVLIGQVLANLIENAHRHAPPGSPITVSGEVHDGRVAVSVTDRGPGVPVGEQRDVFERFVRFDTGGRAGLGLAIARTFVEAHGERIWVEDVPDGGARFVFTLPISTGHGSTNGSANGTANGTADKTIGGTSNGAIGTSNGAIGTSNGAIGTSNGAIDGTSKQAINGTQPIAGAINGAADGARR